MARTNEFATFFVRNLDELAKVHVAEIGDGSLAWVESLKTYFSLDKFSSLTPDGINVLAPAPGSPISGSLGARWIRQEDILDGELQPIWHINEITGNDENDGKTADTALKTYAELMRRLKGVVIDQFVTVFIDSDLTEEFLVEVELGSKGSLNHQGTRTLLRSSTITSHVDYDSLPAPIGTVAPVFGSITDATLLGASSWTDLGLVNKLIVLTDRAAPVAAWIAKDLNEPPYVQPKTSRYSPFFNPEGGGTTNPVDGESYAIYSLTRLGGGTEIASTGLGTISFFDLDLSPVDEPQFISLTKKIAPNGVFLGTCSIHGINLETSAGAINFSRCMVSGLKRIRSNTNDFNFCLFKDDSLSTLTTGGRIRLFGSSIFQGGPPLTEPFSTGMAVANGGEIVLSTGVDPESVLFGIADCELGVVVGPSSLVDLQLGRIYGLSSIFIRGVTVDAGGSIYVMDPISFLGGLPIRFPLYFTDLAGVQAGNFIGDPGTPFTYTQVDTALQVHTGIQNTAFDANILPTFTFAAVFE